MNRYYDSSVGRFLSIDPVSEIPDYTYAANNPLSYVDPDGLWLVDAFWLVVDVITCVFAPTPANFAMIALDLACFADPTGVASTAIHVGRIANTARKAVKAVKSIGKLVSNVGRGTQKANRELTKVGRWMSESEHNAMVRTGIVQESRTGTTHVASPANINAFSKQAKPGSIYVEFEVPINSVKQTQEGWGKIIGPNSLEGRFASKKGLPVPEMPYAFNIIIKGRK